MFVCFKFTAEQRMDTAGTYINTVYVDVFKFLLEKVPN